MKEQDLKEQITKSILGLIKSLINESEEFKNYRVRLEFGAKREGKETSVKDLQFQFEEIK